jgi:hypothetical protein
MSGMSTEIPGTLRRDSLSILSAAAAADLARSNGQAPAIQGNECGHCSAVPGSDLFLSDLRQLAALVVQFNDPDVASRTGLSSRRVLTGDMQVSRGADLWCRAHRTRPLSPGGQAIMWVFGYQVIKNVTIFNSDVSGLRHPSG